MKKILFLVIVLLAGLGLGGGAAFGTLRVLGIGTGPAQPKQIEESMAPGKFVPSGKILAPLVFANGNLAGYASFEVQLEVDETKADFVAARMPMLLHAVNMRTYRTPMAAGPDGMLPNLATFRKIVESAAAEAFGKGIVRKVAITAALPA